MNRCVRLRIGAGLAAVLGLGALAVGLWYLSRPEPPKPGLTRPNYNWIQLGMTLDEVESILGHAPGDYRSAERKKQTRGIGTSWDDHQEGNVQGKTSFHEWVADHCLIHVIGDKDSRVIYKSFQQ